MMMSKQPHPGYRIHGERLPQLWPMMIIVSAIGACLLVFGDVTSPIRPVFVLWFLCVCPGMAFVRLLQIREGGTELTLALALSLALDTIVAGVMLYADVWSPKGALLVLACMSVIGALIQITALNLTVSTSRYGR